MNASPLLIETICIKNGRVRNIKFHNQRCNASRKALFESSDNIDLRKFIAIDQAPSGVVKCRITYNDKVETVEYESYTIRPINSLEYIEIGDFEYSFKYADRKKIKTFFNQRGDKDDILMTKNGFLTDTSYGNVALRKNGQWYTPEEPLLKGTRRAMLLEKGKLIPMKIHVNQIDEFDAISIFNSMIPFKRVLIVL